MSDYHHDSGSAVSSGDASQSATGILRLASQLFGLALLLIGFYYGLSILTSVIGYIRDPEGLEAPAEKMAVVLNLSQATVPVGEQTLPVGRSAGMAALILWYLAAGWITLTVVSVGGRLMLASFNERREFYAATKEMMAAVRREQEMAGKGGGKHT